MLPYSSAKSAQKSLIKRKTTTGRAERISQPSVARCGGVAARRAKSNQAANSVNI